MCPNSSRPALVLLGTTGLIMIGEEGVEEGEEVEEEVTGTGGGRGQF